MKVPKDVPAEFTSLYEVPLLNFLICLWCMDHGYYRRGSCYSALGRACALGPPMPSSDLNGAPLQALDLRMGMGCARRMAMPTPMPSPSNWTTSCYVC